MSIDIRASEVRPCKFQLDKAVHPAYQLLDFSLVALTPEGRNCSSDMSNVNRQHPEITSAKIEKVAKPVRYVQGLVQPFVLPTSWEVGSAAYSP